MNAAKLVAVAILAAGCARSAMPPGASPVIRVPTLIPAPTPPPRSADWQTGYEDARSYRPARWPRYDEPFRPRPDPLRPAPVGPMPPGRWIHNSDYEAGYRAGLSDR